jgi:hypothetical protein
MLASVLGLQGEDRWSVDCHLTRVLYFPTVGMTMAVPWTGLEAHKLLRA